MSIRTPDAIASDLHEQTWHLVLQEHQQALHPHAVTLDGLQARMVEIKKTVCEMEQALARMKEKQA